MNKFILTSVITFFCIAAYAQPKTVEKAIIKMQTEINFPENFGGGGGAGGGDGNAPMGMPRSMEASTTVYMKGDMSKTESVTDFGNNTVITDKKNKRTTTLMEAMGRKTGFYSTENDEEEMRARMDSARARRADSLRQMGLPIAQPSKPEIQYIDETKKIAGYTCKKAILRSKNQRGEVNESIVWYCPDFKVAQNVLTGGNRGMMNMAGLNGVDQIEGFPMEYEFERSNGMKMHMIVTKVQLDANIDDKVFEIPKGYDIKPIKEMQGGRGFRFGGGNP
jgi:GLPGLI family protein